MLDNPWIVIPFLIVLYLTVYAFVKRLNWYRWRIIWAVWIVLIVLLLTIRLLQTN